MSGFNAAEQAVRILAIAMFRKGLLDADDLADAIDRAELGGAAEMERAVQMLEWAIVRADGQSPSEWRAEKRRDDVRRRTAYITGNKQDVPSGE